MATPWFTKGRYLYKEPQRLTPSEARLNRLRSELDRVQRLEDQAVRLSVANKTRLSELKEFETKFAAELEARRRRVEELNQRDPSFRRSPAYKSAVSRLFQLSQRRSALRQAAAAEQRQKSFQKLFVDRRHFSFNADDALRTVFGSYADLSLSRTARRVFKTPVLAIPCVQRATRREVMFAKGHGGKGHRGRRRFNPLSLIGC